MKKMTQTNENEAKAALLGKTGSGTSRRAWIAAAAVLVAAGVAGGWYFAGGSAAPQYVTNRPAHGDLVVSVTATGTLEPVRSVSIGSELSGIVSKVNVDVNSTVKAGDVLIELDTAKLVSAVNQAKATLASAKAALGEADATAVEARLKMKRYEELNKTSGGKLPSRLEMDEQRATVLKTEAAILSAKAKIADAQAQLQTQETNLSKASIVSPVDGVVLARSVEPGYAVAASLQAVELLTVATDLRELELQVDIDEADVGEVKPGQTSSFTVAAYPNRTFDAALQKVAYGATTSTTTNVVTYTGYLNVPNQDLSLRPGMTATATIETAKRDNVLLVPNTAFRFRPKSERAASTMSFMMPPRTGSKQAKDVSYAQTEKEQTIYVLRNGVAQPLKVRTGLTDGRRTEILSDNLSEQDEVIVEQRAQKAS